jgi:hypothetical protein
VNELRLQLLEYASEERAEHFGGGGLRVVDGGAGIRGTVNFDWYFVVREGI